jgi:hypothetical protein
MTRSASLGEAAAMRIGVAVAAVAKRNSNVAWLFIGRSIVAEFTADLNMQPGERIPAERVIKAQNTDCFPVDKVVALQAIGAEAFIVRILMTISTTRGHTQKRSGKVCNANRCRLTSVDVVR